MIQTPLRICLIGRDTAMKVVIVEEISEWVWQNTTCTVVHSDLSIQGQEKVTQVHQLETNSCRELPSSWSDGVTLLVFKAEDDLDRG